MPPLADRTQRLPACEVRLKPCSDGQSKDCVMRGLRPCALLFATVFCAGPKLAVTALSAAESNQTEIVSGIDWSKERDFWSFRPPTARARPVVTNKQWPSQPLDYFVLARLEQTNLSPSPE